MKFNHFLYLFSILLINIIFIPNKINATNSDDELKMWMLSDIQPRGKSERKDFERAIKDINNHIKDIDFAIVAGDIVDKTVESNFDWYIDAKNKSYIKKWYEIAGNHDLKPDEGLLFKEKLNENLNYYVIRNNLLIIFMSDEKRSSASDISDNTFQWWKDLVTNNQDKIIIVVTHAPLNGSGITFSSFERRHIIDSKRFRKVLNKFRVDLWISGHLHIPHSIKNNLTNKSEYNDTVFLNISSIRTELLGFKDSESFIISLKCGSDILDIKSRNHTNAKFNSNQIYNHRLTKSYLC
jgi:Icc-related predicted phosphoesterase